MRPAILVVTAALVAVQAVAGMPHVRRVRDADTSQSSCTTAQEELGYVYQNSSQYQHNSEAAIMWPRASCSQWKNYTSTTGLYIVSPTGGCEVQVYCDMCLHKEEGWIVIQRRIDGDVDFHNKGWTDYRNGFGDYFRDYWMGLEKIHHITSSGSYELYVGFSRMSGLRRYAVYTGFSVDSEDNKYKMTYDAFDERSHSSVSDGLSRHKELQFTTRGDDYDNDDVDNLNCAEHDSRHFGGWWFGHGNDDNNYSNNYDACFVSNLNGQYYHSAPNTAPNNGIQWKNEGASGAVLSSTIMAIRRV